MYPSKAERILSQYRRIAPKPPPLPPSASFGTTDPSSTCASVDSFTSSAKCKRSRKRKADDSLSGKALKAPKSMGSCLSNTGGASSVTQGASDGTVPLGDPRSASQISHGSMVMGVEDFVEMSHGTGDAPARSSAARLAGYDTVTAPLYGATGKMLQQPEVYMSSDVSTQQQHAFSMLHQKLDSGYHCTPGGGHLEKDTGFMERAAAASATVLPDRSVSLSMCDVAGGRGIGYVGGGFTEMIRGITRLPTAADVQSLMQARVFAACGGQATAGGSSSSSCPLSSSARNKEVQSRRSDPFCLPLTVSGCITGKPMCVSEAGPVRESDTELVTLSLLPNVPSKTSLPAKVSVCDGCLRAQPPMYGVTQPPPHRFRHVTEKPWLQQMSSRFETSAKVAVRDGALTAQPLSHGVTHVADFPSSLHQQVPSRLEPPGKAAVLEGSSSAHPSILGSAHVSEGRRHQQFSSQLERLTSVASRESCMSQVGVQLDSKTSAMSLPPKTLDSGILMSRKNMGINLFGVGMPSSPFVTDGSAIDEVYLEQVYGCSTDPVLLLDNSNQVLWFNKSYDKALKSASERLSGSSNSTGPYIDPLGHPTPLCSFIPSAGRKPAPARATLWGFLKKLVIQESEAPLQRDQPGPPSQLQPCTGEGSVKARPVRLESVGTMVCAIGSRLTTVTLESITEFHMDAPSAVESAEAAEARLGSGSEPAFITDSSNRVRWVNASLKQMLGLANLECSMNASPRTSSNTGAEVAVPGFVDASTFVVCCTEKIPRSAWAFSCRVNLEWMRGNKRRSMTVPCDVSRLACLTRSSDVDLVWQFDMAVSLCLNVPS